VRNARGAAELVDFRLHDLRLPIIGALLGHKHTTTTARYAHLSADPLRAANDAVGARIAAAMSRGMSATTLPSGTRPCHGCFRAHHRERQLYVDIVEKVGN
jgi:hypothetical protein